MKRLDAAPYMKIIPILFIIILLSMSVAAAEKEDMQLARPEIKNIEITDTAIKIEVSGPIHYKVHRPADPFKAEIDLEGVGLGKYTERMYSQKSAVAEIAPIQIETPTLVSKLDILLISPAPLTPEVRGSSLILHLGEVQKTVASQEETAPAIEKAVLQETEIPEAVRARKPKVISSVAFDKTEDGVELVFKSNDAMPEPAVFELDNKVIIDMPGFVMGGSLPSSMRAPVRDIKYAAESDKLRFTVYLDKGVQKEIIALDNELIVDIYRNKDLKERESSSTVFQPDASKGTLTKKNNLVSLDFQDADIVAILRLLGDVSGYNMVIHPDVKGKITMKLMNVPWEQALDIILKTFNLEKTVEGNIVRIATIKAFQDEKKAITETKEVFGRAEDIATKIFVVNYASVDKVKETLDKAKILSPRGSMSTDVRTRSIIIKDIPSRFSEIQEIVTTLDRPTAQVLIDARMVEVNTDYSRSLGVEWGGWFNPSWGSNRYTASGSTGGPITGLWPVTNFGGASSTDGRDSGPQTYPVVNLGTTATPAGAISLGFLNASQTVNLALRISALEDNGKLKMISNPKILTVDNEKAEIKQGAQIPVTTRNPDGTYSTVYKDANLKLIVTPQVTPEGTIFMKVEVTKDEPDFTRTDSLGNPTIVTKQAMTQVLLKDGETIVIGGILKSSESNQLSAVPGLSKIPVLGWLFKRDTKETSSEETMVFITPRIVKR